MWCDSLMVDLKEAYSVGALVHVQAAAPNASTVTTVSQQNTQD